MPHHVYANGNEICSRSADGTSDMAPDVCFSPGAPPPGVPVCYMNTCKASDITNGSRTVFIKGKEICLEDRSYFATSYGDEPATQGLARGIVSAAVQGRCFFIGWSGNVFAEGLAVTRHLDMVTHNHENPANTPPRPYISVEAAGDECKGDLKAVEEKCKPDPKHKGVLERALGPAKFKKVENLLKKGGLDPDGWVATHCEGLMIKPRSGSAGMKELAENIKEMTGDLEGVLEEELGRVLEEIEDKIDSAAGAAVKSMFKRKAINAGVRHTAALVGGPLAGATETAAGVYTILDGVAGGLQAIGTGLGTFSDFWAASSVIEEIPGKLKEALADAVSNPSKAMANFMSVLARLNACARARRCILVPYKDTKGKEPLKGNGCCPGQTGHHLLPGEMFYDQANCSKYGRNSEQHKGAPSLCTEGTSNDPPTGTHGAMHKNFACKMRDYTAPGWVFEAETEIDYEDARDMAIDSVQEVFPESACDPKCLKAQLDSYYEKLCDPNTLSAKAGVTLKTPDDGSDPCSE